MRAIVIYVRLRHRVKTPGMPRTAFDDSFTGEEQAANGSVSLDSL